MANPYMDVPVCVCGLPFQERRGRVCRHCEAEMVTIDECGSKGFIPRARLQTELFVVVRNSLFVRSFHCEQTAQDFAMYLRLMGVKDEVHCRRSVFLH